MCDIVERLSPLSPTHLYYRFVRVFLNLASFIKLIPFVLGLMTCHAFRLHSLPTNIASIALQATRSFRNKNKKLTVFFGQNFFQLIFISTYRKRNDKKQRQKYQSISYVFAINLKVFCLPEIYNFALNKDLDNTKKVFNFLKTR